MDLVVNQNNEIALSLGNKELLCLEDIEKAEDQKFYVKVDGTKIKLCISVLSCTIYPSYVTDNALKCDVNVKLTFTNGTKKSYGVCSTYLSEIFSEKD